VHSGNQLQVLPKAGKTQNHHQKREDWASDEYRDEADYDHEYGANDSRSHQT
jgi:hypothetical protein